MARGGKSGRNNRRKRRIAKQDRDDYPRRERRETEPWIDRQQDSTRGGYALSAFETEEHRKEMAQKHRDRASRNARCVHAVTGGVARREEHGEPTLSAVADESKKRRELLPHAQHVWRARIAPTVPAPIRKPES